MFLGYSLFHKHKGYKCLSADLYISASVKLDESSFPFSTNADFGTKHSSDSSSTDTATSPGTYLQSVWHSGSAIRNSSLEAQSVTSPISSNSPYSTGSAQQVASESSPDLSSSSNLPKSVPATSSYTTIPLSVILPIPAPPSQPQPTTNCHPMLTRSKTACYPTHSQAYLSSLQNPKEPASVSEALTHPDWLQAMQAEYSALIKNDTWTLVPHTADMNVVGNKWVFRLK